MRNGKQRSILAVVVTLGLASAPATASSTWIPCNRCRIPYLLDPAERISPRLPAPRPAVDLSFHSGTAATGRLIDSFASQMSGSPHDGFAIETSRLPAKHAYSPDRIGRTRERRSLSALLLHYDGHLGDDDILSFGLGGSYEKRRFALDLANGHMVRSKSVGIEGAWTHGAHCRVSAGYRDDMGGPSRSSLTRGIEITEGADRSQRGPWMAIGFTPGSAAGKRPVSFGIRMQAMRLSEGDRVAMGAPSRLDNRVALTASIKLH